MPNVNNPQEASWRSMRTPQCANSAQQVTCFAPEWAVVNYVERELNKSNCITFRNEYFDDMRGNERASGRNTKGS